MRWEPGLELTNQKKLVKASKVNWRETKERRKIQKSKTRQFRLLSLMRIMYGIFTVT